MKQQLTIPDALIDFGLPALALVILAVLLLTGADGEVKAMLAVVVGWLTRSAIKRAPSNTPKA